MFWRISSGGDKLGYTAARIALAGFLYDVSPTAASLQLITI
jgi:hypothetical protein